MGKRDEDYHTSSVDGAAGWARAHEDDDGRVYRSGRYYDADAYDGYDDGLPEPKMAEIEEITGIPVDTYTDALVDEGKTVEIPGLDGWTLKMTTDAVLLEGPDFPAKDVGVELLGEVLPDEVMDDLRDAARKRMSERDYYEDDTESYFRRPL